MKKFVLFAFILMASVAAADPVTLPYVYASGTVVTPANLNGNFNALKSGVNNINSDQISAISTTKITGLTAFVQGLIVNIMDSQIAATAAIQISKIASLTERLNDLGGMTATITAALATLSADVAHGVISYSYYANAPAYTTVSLGFTATTSQDITVFVGGVMQATGSYTVSGATMTFTEALLPNYKVSVLRYDY